jgi:phosphate transport system protein
MAVEMRTSFHRRLGEIDQDVLQLFSLVSEGIAAATDAFLSNDVSVAETLAARDHLIDELYRQIEEHVQRQLALQQPVAGDLRFLLSVLRIVPELERSHDLAEHIARRAAMGLSSNLPPRVRGLVDEMGRIGVTMWRACGDAFIDRDASAAARLRSTDDSLDELHAALIAAVSDGTVPPAIAMEMALVGRFFERLGDHAVNVAERVRYLITGN